MKKLILIAVALVNVTVGAQHKKNETETIITGVVMNAIESFSESDYKTETFKIKHSKGILSLNLGKTSIEGYDGNEIIFERKALITSQDERSKGLQAVSQNGMIDNTGIGINVTTKNDVVEVKEINMLAANEIKVKVPKNIKIVYKNESQFAQEISIKNMSNEIEADLKYSSLNLENISGPLTANLVHGNADVKFNQTVKGPVSIISIYGFVDVAISSKANVNFKLSTNYGEILTDPNLNIKLNPNEENGLFKNIMTGKMNSGGTDFQLRSDYNKIYIRSNNK